MEVISVKQPISALSACETRSIHNTCNICFA